MKFLNGHRWLGILSQRLTKPASIKVSMNIYIQQKYVVRNA